MKQKIPSETQYPDNDTQFTECVLKDARNEGDHVVLETEAGCLYVDKVPGVEPKKGDLCRFYGKGMGFAVRGVFVNGQKIRYQTAAEEEAAHKQSVLTRKQEQRDAFEKDRINIDVRVAALPEVFQKRLARFRAGNPNFRWEFEAYELFACEQAVAFAEALKTVEALKAFGELKYEEQIKAVPAMSDGHSGNTFGCAFRLAYWFLAKPENVVIEHGAMVPLVGCKEYGCTHQSEQ